VRLLAEDERLKLGVVLARAAVASTEARQAAVRIVNQ
jgi:hypothetical protein